MGFKLKSGNKTPFKKMGASPNKFFSLALYTDKSKIKDPKTGKKHCVPGDPFCPAIDMWKMGLGATLGATALYTPQYFGKGLKMKDLIKKSPPKK